jgi:hypothetical protein
MSAGMNDPDLPKPAPRRWDADLLTSIVAIIIGVFAVGTSLYTALIMREQLRAQVWPAVEIASSDLSGFKVLVINNGVGPAIIKRVQISAAGRPMHDWSEIFSHFGEDPEVRFFSTISNTIIPANKQIEALIISDPALAKRLLPHLATLDKRLCYCSVLGECWQIDKNTKSPTGDPVASCGIPDKDDFKD